MTQGDEAQLSQTIEMFEVITQSQPHDYQSLEILKEAYQKLGREKDLVNTSKRIAKAYVELGQLSSAILEYETILQRFPDDPDVRAALSAIENKANNVAAPAISMAEPAAPKVATVNNVKTKKAEKAATKIDDGRATMQKIFVDGKIISAGDFDLCWPAQDFSVPPSGVIEPFIQILSDRGIMPTEKALKILSDKSRLAFLPLEKYDIDMDLTRKFPAETCKRWCVLPFDRMSKSILMATANPFNQQAAKELAEATQFRIVWYLAPPTDLLGNLRKAFR